MKATIEEVNKVQRRVKVELSQDEVKSAFTAELKKLQKKAQLKGFRPGKAPLNILKQVYGDMVAYDVANQLVKNHLFSALEEEKIRAIASPVLETMDMPKEGEEYRFTALVDVLPELKIEGYKGLSLSYKPVPVDDQAVEKELESILRRRGKMHTVEDKPAVMGNIVTFTQKAFNDQGEEIDALKLEQAPVELKDETYLIKEIQDALVGMKLGEEKKLHIKLPNDFRHADHAAKTYEFHVNLEKIQELELAELNDAFAKEMGAESVEALRSNVEGSLFRYAQDQKRAQLETAIMECLIERNQLDVPPSMTDQVIDSMIAEMNWPNDNAKKEALKNMEYRSRYRQTAERRAKGTLLLSQVIKEENIEASDEDVDRYLMDMFSYPGQKRPENDMLEKLKSSFNERSKETIVFNKAVDFIIENATIVESV